MAYFVKNASIFTLKGGVVSQMGHSLLFHWPYLHVVIKSFVKVLQLDHGPDMENLPPPRGFLQTMIFE